MECGKDVTHCVGAGFQEQPTLLTTPETRPRCLFATERKGTHELFIFRT
jgi:hypothetical protein